MIYPPAPRPGDLIALVCPSSPLAEGKPVEVIAEAVEALGFQVRIGASCRSGTDCGYAAAPASVKARDINEAFADPAVKAVWCVRGGSTAWQIPPLLDYDAIARNPKPLIGFSDITTLHLAVNRRCGLVTFHGPTANRVPDWTAGDSFSWRSLQNALGLEGRMAAENPPGESIQVLRPGRAQGELTGGNLSLIAASLGTPWQVDAKDRILFLEDVGEAVYALDRMLSQLQYAGILEDAAGIIFGDFSDCRNAYREDYGPPALLRDFTAGWRKPVLYNVRSAHCSPMATLPLGAVCIIDGNTITLDNPRRQ